MESILSQDPQQLRGHLQSILEQARENEQKLQRFQEQEMRLISARTLSELIPSILDQYRRAFGLQTVSLVLYDPDYEIRRILREQTNLLEKERRLIFVNDQLDLHTYLGETPQPYLGAMLPERHQGLFYASNESLRSIAILPLMRQNGLIGSLNLGSHTAERFQEDSASDFLQRLANIVAICLENATNHERLKRVGLTDALTGVNNRRFFDQRLGEEVARSLRAQEPMSCLFMDLDHFKHINDQYGHQIGDQALRETASLIRDELRNSDVLGRYGGEAFAALLPNTSLASAMEIAERIRQRIASHTFYNNEHTLTASISIGIAEMAANTVPIEIATLANDLLERADFALY